MPEFLVEFYAFRCDGASVEECAALAGMHAAELSVEGTPVRYVRSIFVPKDETCFFLYEAGSADDVREAASRAGVPFEHVAELSSESRGGS
jgi:hypothetical protein